MSRKIEIICDICGNKIENDKKNKIGISYCYYLGENYDNRPELKRIAEDCCYDCYLEFLDFTYNIITIIKQKRRVIE